MRLDVGVDRELLAELITIERSCCSFLEIEFDDRRSVLRIASAERGHEETLAALAGFFEGTPFNKRGYER